MRVPGHDRVAVRARLRVADGGEHALLEHGRHRVLQALGLLVDLVPGDAEHVGEEALDQPVAAHDALGVLGAGVGEGDRLVARARDVAVALQAADHLVHRRRRELHRPRDVGPRHRQTGLLQPEESLEVLLLGDGGLVGGHTNHRNRLRAHAADAGHAGARSPAPRAASGARWRPRSPPAAPSWGSPRGRRTSSMRSPPSCRASTTCSNATSPTPPRPRRPSMASPSAPAGWNCSWPTPASPTTARSATNRSTRHCR